MIREKTNDFTALYAEQGFVITNGDVYGTRVYLAPGADEDEWYETDDVEGGCGAGYIENPTEARSIFDETEPEEDIYEY